MLAETQTQNIHKSIEGVTFAMVHAEATQAAKAAVAKMLADWKAKTGGNEYGEPMYCGFAWVEVYDVRSNSKMGKAMQAVGFRKGYRGGLELWDPAQHRGQSMDCKEVGAQAYADVLRGYGLKAYMGSRAD